jgi:glycine cleavage system transcriptional repressor
MSRHVAISVLGKDRPGIVAAITRALFNSGCNLEDSSMTSLRSEFAMIVIAALPAGATIDGLRTDLQGTARALGLTVTLKQLSPAENKRTVTRGRPYIISVYGADKPGIVCSISRFLSEKKINITDVQTSVRGAGAKATYIMFLEVSIPPSYAPASLTKTLGAIGRKLAVTIAVNPAESPSL